jgi:nitroreductase
LLGTIKARLSAARWRMAFFLKKNAIAFFGSNGFLASVYFTVFNRKFYREHVAVLRGVARNLDLATPRQGTSPVLRRNIHRIEKGLSMRVMRDVFAQDYVGGTVDMFVGASRRGNLDPMEMKWAGDVLRRYFDTVHETPRVAAARRRFESVGHCVDDRPFAPYESAQRRPSGIAFDDLRALFLERRSVRWFDGRPVDPTLVAQAVEAASFAPSACNRQPFFFVVFTNPAEAARVAKFAGGTAGYADNIPCLIVVVGDLSSYVEERDRHLIYIDAALASMQLMLALQTLGLSSCAINWPDVESREQSVQKELGLEAYERPVMFIAVGGADPAGRIPFSQKKPAELLMRLRA